MAVLTVGGPNVWQVPGESPVNWRAARRWTLCSVPDGERCLAAFVSVRCRTGRGTARRRDDAPDAGFAHRREQAAGALDIVHAVKFRPGHGLIDEGEAREVAQAHAALALKTAAEGRKLAILSGGELTVTMKGHGRGGPVRRCAKASSRWRSFPRVALKRASRRFTRVRISTSRPTSAAAWR